MLPRVRYSIDTKCAFRTLMNDLQLELNEQSRYIDTFRVLKECNENCEIFPSLRKQTHENVATKYNHIH